MSVNKKGFTIVELLVVVVVIAILAAITFFSYNGINRKADVSRRLHNVSALAKIMHLYASETGDTEYIGQTSGCGGYGMGSGYLGGEYVGYRTIAQCLVDAGYTEVDSLRKQQSVIKLGCMKDGVDKVYLLATIQNRPSDPNLIESLCNPTIIPGWGDVRNWDVLYNMNYYVEIK